MKTLFESSFLRDLKKIRNKHILKQVDRCIEQVKSSGSPDEIAELKKMQGFDTLYRIRLGDYRIGIEIIGKQAIFVRILNRKDIYRYFP